VIIECFVSLKRSYTTLRNINVENVGSVVNFKVTLAACVCSTKRV